MFSTFFCFYTMLTKKNSTSLEIRGDGLRKHIRRNSNRSYASFGLHPCGINALNKLGKVINGLPAPAVLHFLLGSLKNRLFS
jgi:hypothetical protein